MKLKLIPTLLYCTTVAFALPLLADDTLTPANPVEVAGTHGRFDFIKFDSGNHRLLACHTENGSLDVIEPPRQS